ncbi:hypothetical protein [Desulforamulus ferrireducens]|uniref:hypothetical protein n=1 Tax=Desulforamulus ferrireducens TaxID=1833852 RepID=UPI00098A1F79|nr:hypothetical protein [Desulforamulus ferrireducens]
MTKKLLFLTLCFLLAISLGCTAKEPDKTEKPQETSAAVMQELQDLKQKGASPEEIANFITDNIAKVPKEDGSQMVDTLEQVQREQLPQFEALFMEGAWQSKLANHYQANNYQGITDPSAIQDAELKTFLEKVTKNGYKVETAEGTFFPIIDYEFYEKFSPYVTADRKDYIEIMSVESQQVPAKDAALVISWDEVLKRAQNQEKFLTTHKDSVKAAEVKKLYQQYVVYTLYGLNNTPLFSYETNTIDPEAKKSYLAAVKNPRHSEYLKMLSGYLDLLAKNNYVLTDEVKQYRDKVSEQ